MTAMCDGLFTCCPPIRTSGQTGCYVPVRPPTYTDTNRSAPTIRGARHELDSEFVMEMCKETFSVLLCCGSVHAATILTRSVCVCVCANWALAVLVYMYCGTGYAARDTQHVKSVESE